MTDSSHKDESEFAAPVLTGPRFASHVVPVEVLKEFEAYKRLIVEVAKALFLSRNPTRQRVTKGFEDRLELGMREVAPGSAQAILLRTEPPPDSQFSLMGTRLDEFDEARDLISQAVAAAAAGAALPLKFPRSALGRFNSFGRTLKADEAIELRRDRASHGPRYSSSVRKKLVLMGQSSFTDAVDLTGTIYEADVERGVFRIQAGEVRTTGTFGPEHEAVILSALRDHSRLELRVIGTGSYDSSERLERIDEVEDASIVEKNRLTEKDLQTRIAELRALKSGWLDGDGQPFDSVALDKVAAALLSLHQHADMRLPYLYPMPDGAVQAEWTVGGWEVSAKIDTATGSTELDAVDVASGGAKEGACNLFDPHGAVELAHFVALFEGKGRN